MVRKVDQEPCGAIIEATYLEETTLPCMAGSGDDRCILDVQKQNPRLSDVAVAAGSRCLADKLHIKH